MNSSRRAILGAFVVIGAFLFALGLFWIGDRRQMFSDNIELHANFLNVSGLSRGSVVRVAGTDAGEVLDIGIPTAPGDPFRVRFRVNSDLQPILREDSVATIQTDGLVGNKFLQVAAGTANAPEAGPGGTIGSREPVEVGDLMQRMNDMAVSGNQAVADIRSGINRTFDALLELNAETTGTIDRIGVEIQSITSVGDGIATNIGGMVEDVRAGRGSIGRILTDDALYNDMRATMNEAEQTIANFTALSNDFRAISEDFRELDLGERIDRVGANVEAATREAGEFTREATELIRTFQGTTGPDGLMADVRTTLDNTNRALSNMVDNTEALKRNWFFRGFFDDRGFFNIDSVSIDEYLNTRFLADKQRITRRLDATGMFDSNGTAALTDTGRQRLDTVMAEYIRYSKEDPLMIEAYSSGSDPEDLLLARDWAVAVRQYLIGKFELQPSYVGVMPMMLTDIEAQNVTDSGVALVLFATRGR